jgi:trans-aconitate methyltransferase
VDWGEVWRTSSGSITAGPSTQSRLRLMLQLVARFAKPYSKLLDVGCGNGELLEAVAKAGQVTQLSGVDVSEVPLEEARRRVPQADLHVLDICVSTLPTRFDVITCMMTLDLVPDDRLAARHLSEMLEPGGHLLLAVQHLKQYGTVLDDRYGVKRHDRASLAALLSQAGLEPVELFSWGFPLFSAYYRLLDAGATDAISPSRTRSAAFRAVSAGLVWLFKVDDFFKWTGRGRVLYGVFRKA